METVIEQVKLQEKLHELRQLHAKYMMCVGLFVAGLSFYGLIYFNILSGGSGPLAPIFKFLGVSVYLIGYLCLLVGIIGGVSALICHIKRYFLKRHLLETYHVKMEDLQNTYWGD